MNQNECNTSKTPHIVLDTDTQTLTLKGRCIPSDPETIFKPLISLILRLSEDHGSFTCDCKLEYFNSSSARYLLQLLKTPANCSDGTVFTTVNWYYEGDDEDSKDFGEDLKELVNARVNLLVATSL